VELKGGDDEEEVVFVAFDFRPLLWREGVLESDGMEADVDGEDLQGRDADGVEPADGLPGVRFEAEEVARLLRAVDLSRGDAIFVVLDDL